MVQGGAEWLWWDTATCQYVEKSRKIHVFTDVGIRKDNGKKLRMWFLGSRRSLSYPEGDRLWAG